MKCYEHLRFWVTTFSDPIPQPSNFALRIGGYSKKDGMELKTEERKVDVAGPLCFAGDKIATQISLPSLTEGDVLVVHDTGANTLSTFSRHCSRSQVMSPSRISDNNVRSRTKSLPIFSKAGPRC